jgi:hypothetical protein
MSDASAILEKPRVGPGDTAHTPRSAETTADTSAEVSPEPRTQASEKKGEVRDYTSRVLESLSPEALRKWKLTGKLPPDVDLKEKPEKQINENELTLAALSSEEREKWRQTGRLPERKEGQASAADADKAGESGKSGESSETSHPLTKVDGLRASKKDAEANALHSKREQTHNARYQADRAKYSEADQKTLAAAAAKFLPMVPKGLLQYFNAAQVHLDHPFTFYRNFVLDDSFRKEVLTAAATGDLGNVIKAMTKHDSARSASVRPRVTSAPAPASSIGGRATAPVNQEDAALSAGNFRTYFAEANRAEFSKNRKGR